MEIFTFMSQSSSVEGLLNACMAALPRIPYPEKTVLVKAMREFENFGAPVLWSSSDVDSDDDYGLTEWEKREAIERFISGYECKESDWLAIDVHARDVKSERQLHIRVEYDELYTGGDYDGVGHFAYVPVSLVEDMAKQDPDGDDGVELAFTKITKMDCMHIVHFSLDEHYNQHGELIAAFQEDQTL